MAVESATYVDGLNPAYPAGGEPIAQGDDHLRLIKQTIKNTFPTLNGPLSAALVPFTPAGSIAANTVQAAIQELDSEKVSKSGDTMTGTFTLNSGQFRIGYEREFALLVEPQGSAAPNSLQYAFGLKYPATDAWAGPRIDFYKGNSVGDGRMELNSGTSYTFKTGNGPSQSIAFFENGESKLRILRDGASPVLSLYYGGVIEWVHYMSGPTYFLTAAGVPNSGVSLSTTPGANWVTNSDERLKKDIQPMSGGLEAILKITPMRFR